MAGRRFFLLRCIRLFTFIALILTTYFYLYRPYPHFIYSNPQTINEGSTQQYKTSSSLKFNFLHNDGYWNFTLHSFIKLKLEADISPDIYSFIQNNVEQLKKVYDPQTNLSEQVKYFRSMAAVAIKINISVKETIILLFTRVLYTKTICIRACDPDRSYIYAQALTSHYHPTSYNITLKNGKTIHFPSILNTSAPEVNKCCLGPEDPRIVIDDDNQVLISFNMIDVDKKRKIWLYDLFKDHQVPLTISDHPIAWMEKNWAPFIRDKKLHFIYSYHPLAVLQCSTDKGTCTLIAKGQKSEEIGSLRGGTQLVRFHNTNYFVSIARTTLSCGKCEGFYRPHFTVLSLVGEQFHLVYVSEPMMLDALPMFSSYFMSQNRNLKEFCDNIIRIMTPGSIIDWQYPDDKLTFTISINDMRSYIVSITGIGKLVQNIISTIDINNAQLLFNSNTDRKLVSHAESMAINYCQTISQTNRLMSDKINMIKQYPKEKIIKSTLDSPTYPQFRVASNTKSESLSLWITSDAVNFGLIGRYLLEYESAHGNQPAGTHLMIDAGGNHGTYGLYSASFNQSVYIFEVLLDYWIVIEELFRLNPKLGERMILYPFGVGNEYRQWKVLPGEGFTRLDFVSSQSSNDTSIIQSYPLDDFVFQPVSVLKIDVEGFEIRMLQGAERIISRLGVGAMLIEIASKRWHWYNMTVDEGISVLEQVTSIGHYSCYVIGRNDGSCPASKIGQLNGIVDTKNISMINLQNGKSEIAPQVFRLSEWRTIMIEMEKNDWSCSFWLESDVKQTVT